MYPWISIYRGDSVATKGGQCHWKNILLGFPKERSTPYQAGRLEEHGEGTQGAEAAVREKLRPEPVLGFLQERQGRAE